MYNNAQILNIHTQIEFIYPIKDKMINIFLLCYLD